MYNLGFPEAHQAIGEYETKHPNDPLRPVSDAAGCLLSEFKVQFDQGLQPRRRPDLKTWGNATFADTLRLGLQADCLALIEKRELAALSEMKQGRALAQQLLSRYPT